ncbi:hypothetical protein [Marinomonas primoryensis]|jgi:hypothetical protein|uniref:hypothetical protein n=1 Tax=Marinomonas primoryensis TaxID=178399 RepID=UPI003703C461
MKNQDIGLLLKLISLEHQENSSSQDRGIFTWPHDWRDWEGNYDNIGQHTFLTTIGSEFRNYAYTTRNLEAETGISKTQISESLRRCIDIGLAKKDRQFGVPRANKKALFEFIVSGIKYVFPAKLGEVTRGIGTSFSAPILQNDIISSGELIPVWPDARGTNKGQAVEPLFKTVTLAIRKDPDMYAMLALIDSIRLGNAREVNIAKDKLKSFLE